MSRKPKYHSEASTSWYLLGVVLLAIMITPVMILAGWLSNAVRSRKEQQ